MRISAWPIPPPSTATRASSSPWKTAAAKSRKAAVSSVITQGATVV